MKEVQYRLHEEWSHSLVLREGGLESASSLHHQSTVVIRGGG
jgi:hypothetical protein